MAVIIISMIYFLFSWFLSRRREDFVIQAHVRDDTNIHLATLMCTVPELGG